MLMDMLSIVGLVTLIVKVNILCDVTLGESLPTFRKIKLDLEDEGSSSQRHVVTSNPPTLLTF